MESFAHDFRQALRGMRRAPGFTAIIALTFALGIGANGAIFSLADRLFMQPAAGLADATLLRRLFQTNVDPRILSTPTRSTFNYQDLREIQTAFPNETPVAGYTRLWPVLPASMQVPLSGATYVTGGYFALLGVHPVIGRFFTSDETEPASAARVAVLSRRLWIAGYGGERNILGRTIQVDSVPYRIIGVAARDFRGTDLEPTDLWLPLGAMPANASFNPVRSSGTTAESNAPWYERGAFLQIIARLRSGADERKLASLATLALRQSEAGNVQDTSSTAQVLTLSAAIRQDAGPGVVSTVTRLGGVAAIVLLIACANIANMLFTRGLERRRDTAVRLALGIGRIRLTRQHLIECVLIALVGGVLAIAVGIWGTVELPRALAVPLSEDRFTVLLRLGGFALAIAIVSGVIAGVLPAITVSHISLTDSLRDSGRGQRFARSPIRYGLVSAQSALSVMLLAAAGLLLRSLENVRSANLGYVASQLLLAHVPYDQPQSISQDRMKLRDLAERIRQIPGVERVAQAANPIVGHVRSVPVFVARDGIVPLGGSRTHLSLVSADFFSAGGIHVIAGRSFSPDDRSGTLPVAIVGAAFARTAWPGASAIGKCVILYARDGPCHTVVGVVLDVHVSTIIEQPTLQVYLPLAQVSNLPGTALLIRVAPTQIRSVTRDVVRMFADSFDDGVRDLVQRMSDYFAPELGRWRLRAALFASAALCGLFVAMSGIFGVVAYNVKQREHEIGIRSALGAPGAKIVASVLLSAMSAVIVGVIVGLFLTIASGQLIASVLYDVTPWNPYVLGCVSLLLVVAGVAASLPVAWRALRVDPVTALRSE